MERFDAIHAAEILCLPEFKRLIAHRGSTTCEPPPGGVPRAGLPLDVNELARQRRDAIPPEEVAPPPL